MSAEPEIVVIGAGHDGLAAAAWLASRGLEVAVLETRDRPGGIAAVEELAPEYRVPGLWPGAERPAPGLVEALSLDSHGLQLVPPAELHIAGLSAGSVRSLRVGHADWASLRAGLEPVLGLLEELARRPPPLLQPRGLSALVELAGSAWRTLRSAGSVTATLEALRAVPMAVSDLACEATSDPLLRAGLAAGALHGLSIGPRAPGSSAALLLRAALGSELPGSEARVAAGGAAGLTRALLAAARAAGAELRLDARVERILLERSAVRGVRLAGGEELRTRAVLSTADPRTTLLELVPAGALPGRIERDASMLRARGTSAVVLLALDGPLELADRPGEPVRHLRIVRDLDDLERAADWVKYGECQLDPQAAGRPFAEVWLPSWNDQTLAPPARHVAVVHLQPLAEPAQAGRSAASTRALERLAESLLAEVAPSAARLVTARLALSPAALAAALDRPGGHLHQLEVALDQSLSLRPMPACSRYATPIEGLFLGGSGCHPGPHARGGAGLLAARALAQRWSS